jgi:hypothetical protein
VRPGSNLRLSHGILPRGSHHGRDLSKGYLPIYEIGSKEVVNVLQLMLNVFFTALVGPLAPTCPNVWRAGRAGVLQWPCGLALDSLLCKSR